MGQVLRMSAYRKAARRPAAQTATAPRYFCMRCSGDRFTLEPSGEVRCASCSAVIRNLAVSRPSAPGGAAPA